MRERRPCVCVLASAPCGTLHAGVTSNLNGRVIQHRDGRFDGFTQRRDVNTIVWPETADNMEAAVPTGKRLKRWRRDWKIVPIEERNPHRADLAV